MKIFGKFEKFDLMFKVDFNPFLQSFAFRAREVEENGWRHLHPCALSMTSCLLLMLLSPASGHTNISITSSTDILALTAK